MSDTGTCVQKAPGPPGGGSVYYGALFVTRYGVRTGKKGSRLPEASDRPGRLRRQGHNGGPADLYCQATARSVSGVSERGVPDFNPGSPSRQRLARLSPSLICRLDRTTEHSCPVTPLPNELASARKEKGGIGHNVVVRWSGCRKPKGRTSRGQGGGKGG